MKRRRFSLIGMLLLIGLLLGAANLALLAVKALAKPARPVPGALLYATGFDDANDADWYQYRSATSVQIIDGALRLSADTAKDNIYSDLNYVFNDFDLRVAARQLSGEDLYSEYGILFRYQDKKNFYLFRVRADGAYRITRSVDGKQEDLSAAHTTPLFALGVNWVNDLRVIGKADRFRFYINGQPLILCPKGSDKFSTWNGEQCLSNQGQTSQELIDPTFPDGKIALGVYEDAASVSVAFDNLLIYSPTE